MNQLARARHFVCLALAALCLASSPIAADPVEAPTAPVRTKAERDALTPERVLASFKAGNQRFVSQEMLHRDLLMEKRSTSAGQHPSAVILSCIDSRAPAEFIFDKGLGEIFNARIAGNVVTSELLGSLEFATAVVGSKLVLVMGHTGCGAINGAIDGVELGHLTGVLQLIEPAVEAVDESEGERVASNRAFQEAVTTKHVELTVDAIRRQSPILRELEEKGDIMIVGAIYDVSTGQVRFLEP